VLRNGILQQVDRPQVLYDRPANLFVAGFIGSPGMNLVEAQLLEQNGGLVVRFGPHDLRLPAETVAERPELRSYVKQTIALGIRPEDLEEPADPAALPEDQRLDVVVDIREDMGSEIFIHFAIDAPPVTAEELKEIVGVEALAAADEQTHHHGNPFIARIARGSSVQERREISLAVATRNLHFFDLETGEGIYAQAA
jgi:multiple sugar transport system ATP-binding protein